MTLKFRDALRNIPAMDPTKLQAVAVLYIFLREHLSLGVGRVSNPDDFIRKLFQTEFIMYKRIHSQADKR